MRFSVLLKWIPIGAVTMRINKAGVIEYNQPLRPPEQTPMGVVTAFVKPSESATAIYDDLNSSAFLRS